MNPKDHAQLLDPGITTAARYNILVAAARSLWTNLEDPSRHQDAWILAVTGLNALLLLEPEDPDEVWDKPGGLKRADTFYGMWLRLWGHYGGARVVNDYIGGHKPIKRLRKHAQLLKRVRRSWGPPPWEFHFWGGVKRSAKRSKPWFTKDMPAHAALFIRSKGGGAQVLDADEHHDALWADVELLGENIRPSRNGRPVFPEPVLWRAVKGVEGGPEAPRSPRTFLKMREEGRAPTFLLRQVRSKAVQEQLGAACAFQALMELIWLCPREEFNDRSHLRSLDGPAQSWRIFGHFAEDLVAKFNRKGSVELSSQEAELRQELLPPGDTLAYRENMLQGMKARGWEAHDYGFGQIREPTPDDPLSAQVPDVVVMAPEGRSRDQAFKDLKTALGHVHLQVGGFPTVQEMDTLHPARGWRHLTWVLVHLPTVRRHGVSVLSMDLVLPSAPKTTSS